ncbi:DUF6049 family protein [Actinomadura viridis]
MRTVIRAVGVTALLSCVMVGMAPAVPALPAEPEPDRGGQSRARAQIALALGRVSPKTATSSGRNSKITVQGTVENRSGHQLQGVTVRLRTSAQRMSSRSQLAQYASGQPSSLTGLPAQAQLPAANGTGGRATFSLSTTTAAIGLRTFGVYPIGVEVVNQYGQVLAGVNTFITFVPNQRSFKPLSVAWVWPLIDRQHRAADDTFIDDQLAADMAPGGRLSGLVDAAATTNTPVTWSIDPALMDDVHTMASGPYTVKAPRAAKGTRKPKSAAAATWLNSLRSASKNDPYFTVPYADPDAVALVRNKMSNHLAIAYANSSVASQVIGRQPTVQMAWPPSGMAGQSTLNELAKLGRLGNGAFLMSSAAFTDPAQGYTPSAATRLATEEGPKRTVVYDETLNKIVSADTRSPGTAVLAEQRFLAETAMITAEAPDLARSLVIAPDRRWNPAPAFAKNLLAYTSGASWMRKTPLDKITGATPQDRVYRGYPDAMEAYELDSLYLDQVADISRTAARFTSVMVEPVTMTYRRAVLRMESTAWRGRTRYKRAVLARQELRERLQDDMGQVRIITTENQRVSLAGSSGRIPITVVNDLPDQTIEVRLEVVPENTARLQIGQTEDQDEVIRLGPGQKLPRWIPVRAAGNGNARVNVRLKSADDRAFGEKVTITVRTTGYGRLALLITGGGLAVLFVGVGVRATRARRRRKAEAAGEGSTGVGPAATGSTAPAPPSAGAGAAEFAEPAMAPESVRSQGSAEPAGDGTATGPAAGPASGLGPEPGDDAGTAADAGPGTDAGSGPRTEPAAGGRPAGGRQRGGDQG